MCKSDDKYYQIYETVQNKSKNVTVQNNLKRREGEDSIFSEHLRKKDLTTLEKHNN